MLGAKLHTLSSAVLAHVNPATGDVGDHFWLHALEAGLVIGGILFVAAGVRWLVRRQRRNGSA